MEVILYNKKFFSEHSDIIKSFEKFQSNTVFQYYEWINIAIKESKLNPLKALNIIKFSALIKKGQIVALAPIIIKNFGKTQGVFILGHDLSSDYVDLLLSDSVNKEDIIFLIKETLRLTNQTTFFFDGVPENSPTFIALNNHPSCCVTKKETCVYLNINNTYEEYFASLKKGVRQNIRTAINRLNTDSREGKLLVFDKNVDSTLANQLQRLYEKRRIDINSHRNNIKYIIYSNIRKISLFFFNYLKYSMKRNNNALVLVYEIDNNIAAFGHALKNKNNDLFFMQVCFNNEFKRYSPGILMFNEYIKTECLKRKPFLIDLTLGTEQYKYDLGGNESFIYSIKFTI